jgi:chemotaxis protein CheX
MDEKTFDEITRQDLVRAITASTEEVFSTMLGMEVSAEVVVSENAGSSVPASGLVSLIGLAGGWSGTGSIACNGVFACKMASALLMTEFESVNEEVLDAIGEITNMIIGNVKTAMEEKVGQMGLSTPTVIFGRNFQTRSARIQEWTGVTFSTGNEKLFVQVCLAPSRECEKKGMRPGFQIPSVVTV